MKRFVLWQMDCERWFVITCHLPLVFFVLFLCGCRTQKRVTESLEAVESSNKEVRVQSTITRDVTLQNVSFRGERKTIEVIEEYGTDSVGNSSLKRKEMRSIVEVADGGSSKLVGKQEMVSNEEELTLKEDKLQGTRKEVRVYNYRNVILISLFVVCLIVILTWIWIKRKNGGLKLFQNILGWW